MPRVLHLKQGLLLPVRMEIFVCICACVRGTLAYLKSC